MRATQKFGEHEQASTRLNFASKSSKGKILRAVKNFNGPFITPIMGETHACGLKTTPDSQSGRKKIHFNFTERVPKKVVSVDLLYHVLTELHNVKIVVEVLKACRNIFVHIRQSSEVFGKSRKYFEVAGMFSEIWVMTRRKSHEFDSEKVGRYIMRFQFQRLLRNSRFNLMNWPPNRPETSRKP